MRVVVLVPFLALTFAQTGDSERPPVPDPPLSERGPARSTPDASAGPSPPTTPVPSASPASTPTPPRTGRVAGKVTVSARDGVRPGEGAVVYLVAAGTAPGTKDAPAGSAAEEPREVGKDERKITMKDKRFTPRVLPVMRGQEVAFPNLDPVFHNVFSLSGKNKFDLGLYKDGASKSRTFSEPGVVRLFCNIHPTMTAYLLVLDNPWYARPGEDGRYTIRGVAPGRYKLKVWDEKGGESEKEIEIAAGRAAAADFELDARGFKELPHKNKFGQDYGQGEGY